jgi:AraC-like DNA-binding protein
VLSCAGFEETNTCVQRRRELPSAGIPVIVTIEGAVRVGGGATEQSLDSFVAGPSDTFEVTDLGRRWRGLQVNLAPPAAAAVLGIPLSEIARQTVALDDLPGRGWHTLVQRLGEAETWPERFALLDRFLLARLAGARSVPPRIGHAWRMLAAHDGRIAVTDLAREVGWSRQHLSARFVDELGFSPKRFARLLRFERAVGAVRSRPTTPWTAIAYECGYYDQAHLVGDFREFAGCTPTAFAARLLPDGGGVSEPA